ncbi:large ribosomal subunit protein bL31c-like [Bidens hawaiensis]|uniref:large ribosomal subunit protein bL31c-like n=1 Tax=Bidens hawaiensis TaxID=980011 RepID=UPI00404AED10
MSINLSNTFLLRNQPPPPSLPKEATFNPPRWTCRKKDIHPEFHEDAKVHCSGEHVLTTGGTKKDYVVDVWSGNHPFYLGRRSANLIDADQVDKFRKKFGGVGGLDQFMQIPTLKGEIVIPPKRKAATGKGKKK